MKLAKFIRSKTFNCSVYYRYKSKSIVIAFFNKKGNEFFRSEIHKVTFAFIRRFGKKDAEEIIKNKMEYV
jgi:hypothetical protein